MKLTLVGFIFMYEKVRIFVLNKSEYKCDYRNNCSRFLRIWPDSGNVA